MKEYRYYLFDLDGTLLDTTDLIAHCFHHACYSHCRLPIQPDQVYPILGLPLKESFQRLLGERKNINTDLLVDTYKRHQLTVYPQYLKIFPNVKSTLRQLRKCGKKIAIVTSRKKETATLYLRRMEIEGYFETVVTPEDTLEHKPHPAPARKALELIRGTRESALFIGDSLFDVECGHRCGMDTALVLWSRSTYVSGAVSPTYTIEDISELVSFAAKAG